MGNSKNIEAVEKKNIRSEAAGGRSEENSWKRRQS